MKTNEIQKDFLNENPELIQTNTQDIVIVNLPEATGEDCEPNEMNPYPFR